jgi:hypothetical protein
MPLPARRTRVIVSRLDWLGSRRLDGRGHAGHPAVGEGGRRLLGVGVHQAPA